MPNDFDTFETIDIALAECRGSLAAAIADIERAGRLRDKLAAEFDRLRSEREALEVYDEAAAAELLGIKAFTLGEMRRKAIAAGNPFPHAAFGTLTRYTRQHIREIIAMHEVGRKAVSGQWSVVSKRKAA